MLRLTLEYLLFIFAASCGVIQLSATWNRLAALSFFRSRTLTYIFAALSIGGGYVWFFAGDDRNRPGLEGAQQFGTFSAGLALAVAATVIVSSLRHRGGVSRRSYRAEGLDALRDTSYFQAVKRSFKAGRGLGAR